MGWVYTVKFVVTRSYAFLVDKVMLHMQNDG